MLSTAIADSGTVVSHIIPWNVHGALFAGTLGIATLQWAPYTFLAYLTPIVTFVMVYVYFLRKDRIPADQNPEQVYGPEPSQAPEPKYLA